MRTICLLAIASLALLGQTVTSVGGNSSWGAVYNVAVDNAGNIYAPDLAGHVVYKVDPTGVTTVVAGTGRAGYSGDGLQATSAQLNAPAGVVIAADGTMYISDSNNHKIRKVAPSGIITTIAGTTAGFAGDGGQASAARLYGPASIAMDGAGNLIFVDFLNLRIRKITPAGVITTVGGTGRVSLSGNGGLATGTDMAPYWLAVARDGTIYASDDGDGRLNGFKRVRKISTNGIITTVTGTGTAAYSGDGGPATLAQFRSVSGVAVDLNGNIFVADAADSKIRKIGPDGIITTYAGSGLAGSTGDGGPLLQARFNFPSGMCTDAAGNLYIADTANDKIRKVSTPPIPQIRTESPVFTSFGGKAGFSSNTYVEIYGLNFATSSRLWGGSDFSGVNAPTSLDGISVTVNGRPAFIYYVSPTQININTPEDLAVGPVALQVKTANGLSNAVMVTRSRISPTLQTVPQFLIGGKQYVVALTPDFATYIGRENMLAGVPFRAAKPGETISIYALGCGPTNPPTQAGVVAAQSSALSLPFELKIGGAVAEVRFAGVVGATIGLYQFNVVVPFVAPGDQPIELTVDGVKNAQDLTIVIGQQ